MILYTPTFLSEYWFSSIKTFCKGPPTANPHSPSSRKQRMASASCVVWSQRVLYALSGFCMRGTANGFVVCTLQPKGNNTAWFQPAVFHFRKDMNSYTCWVFWTLIWLIMPHILDPASAFYFLHECAISVARYPTPGIPQIVDIDVYAWMQKFWAHVFPKSLQTWH